MVFGKYQAVPDGKGEHHGMNMLSSMAFFFRPH